MHPAAAAHQVLAFACRARASRTWLAVQVDFPIVYASGQNGTAGPSPTELAKDLEPLFDCIVKHVAPPAVRVADPLQLLVTNLDYDDFKGRLAIGRVTAGHVMRGEQIIITKPGALALAVTLQSCSALCVHVVACSAAAKLPVLWISPCLLLLGDLHSQQTVGRVIDAPVQQLSRRLAHMQLHHGSTQEPTAEHGSQIESHVHHRCI